MKSSSNPRFVGVRHLLAQFPRSESKKFFFPTMNPLMKISIFFEKNLENFRKAEKVKFSTFFRIKWVRGTFVVRKGDLSPHFWGRGIKKTHSGTWNRRLWGHSEQFFFAFLRHFEGPGWVSCAGSKNGSSEWKNRPPAFDPRFRFLRSGMPKNAFIRLFEVLLSSFEVGLRSFCSEKGPFRPQKVSKRA